MRYALLAAAAAASLLLAGCAGDYYGPSDMNNLQPSGGYMPQEIGAPTGNLSGAPMGAANMNGPLGNGQPLDPDLRNGDARF